jgi:hypothetical protein
MKSQTISGVDRSKFASIMALFIMAGLIILTGTVFSIFSVIRNISFMAQSGAQSWYYLASGIFSPFRS